MLAGRVVEKLLLNQAGITKVAIGFVVAYGAGWFKGWDLLSESLSTQSLGGAVAVQGGILADQAARVVEMSGYGLLALTGALGISAFVGAVFDEKRGLVGVVVGLLVLTIVLCAVAYAKGIFDSVALAMELARA
ncbi:MAG: hypothetical protein ABJ215_17515 [Alphaproteobacteria bacterium]